MIVYCHLLTSFLFAPPLTHTHCLIEDRDRGGRNGNNSGNFGGSWNNTNNNNNGNREYNNNFQQRSPGEPAVSIVIKGLPNHTVESTVQNSFLIHHKEYDLILLFFFLFFRSVVFDISTLLCERHSFNHSEGLFKPFFYFLSKFFTNHLIYIPIYFIYSIHCRIKSKQDGECKGFAFVEFISLEYSQYFMTSFGIV